MNNSGIEKECASLLLEKEMKIAVAESCTGGLISCRMTNIPGSSGYFDSGFVTYSNEAKVKTLGVSEKTIMDRGAVSEETAREMAQGALERSGADIAVAVTGIAGPSGGSPEKPVGTVFIAVATRKYTTCEKFLFIGSRLEIRDKTCQAALGSVIKTIMGAGRSLE